MRTVNPLALGTLCLVLGSSAVRSSHASAPVGASSRAPSSEPAQKSGAASTTLENRAKAIASYELFARLDTALHVIHGEGKIRWTNPSEVDASEIYLHLYMNAFKNDKSLFLRSPFGAGRSGAKATDYGYIEVESLTLEGTDAHNLWKNVEWQMKDDSTDARVPLPSPIAPGETVTFEVSFESKLPRIVERTGYSQDYHFVAQWFPKLAKREPDGTWAHFAYNPQSEYYADFGNYRVTLEVPNGFVVGATGKQTQREVRGNVVRLTYSQDSVHDFAFAAWDQFVSTRTTIDGVAVELLQPPGYERATEVTLGALRHALPHFSQRYGRYPYPTLTVVHPPQDAENSGGMEYPTLITTGGPWYAPYLGVRALEAVTVHELGHQWFYGLLASNEHAWPFLDEGVNSYAEAVALGEFYGAGSLLHTPCVDVAMTSAVRPLAIAFGQDEIVGQAASEFTSFRSLGAHVYSRTATILDTAARVYGEDRLRKALARYTRDYRFSHPTPTDLFTELRAELGEQAVENLHRAVFERGRVDYLVRSLQSVQKTDDAGVFGDDAEVHEHDSGAPAPDAPWLSRVVVARQGDLEFPVTVRLVFEDGSSIDQRWSGHGETHALTYTSPSRLVGAMVDPEHRVRLDEDLLNNARRESSPLIPRVWERAVYYFGLLLALFGP